MIRVYSLPDGTFSSDEDEEDEDDDDEEDEEEEGEKDCHHCTMRYLYNVYRAFGRYSDHFFHILLRYSLFLKLIK